MKEQIIKTLAKRLDLLDQPDFELETWKTGTVAALYSLLGPEDPRLVMLQNLKIDYSSWALRDATANYNPRESARKNAREILSAILSEYELPDKKSKQNNSWQQIIKQHIDAATYKEITNALKNKESVLPILKKCNKETLAQTLAAMIKAEK